MQPYSHHPKMRLATNPDIFVFIIHIMVNDNRTFVIIELLSFLLTKRNYINQNLCSSVHVYTSAPTLYHTSRIWHLYQLFMFVLPRADSLAVIKLRKLTCRVSTLAVVRDTRALTLHLRLLDAAFVLSFSRNCIGNISVICLHIHIYNNRM